LAAPFEPLVKDVVFTRIPAGNCTNPAFRQHCTGTFSQGLTTVVVQNNDGQLTLSRPTNSIPTRAEPSSSTSLRASGWWWNRPTTRPNPPRLGKIRDAAGYWGTVA